MSSTIHLTGQRESPYGVMHSRQWCCCGQSHKGNPQVDWERAQVQLGLSSTISASSAAISSLLGPARCNLHPRVGGRDPSLLALGPHGSGGRRLLDSSSANNPSVRRGWAKLKPGPVMPKGQCGWIVLTCIPLTTNSGVAFWERESCVHHH